MTPATTTDEFMSIEDFADSRGVHRSTAYRLVPRGTLKATRVGNRLMISAANAADFDARRETGRQLWTRSTAGAMTGAFERMVAEAATVGLTGTPAFEEAAKRHNPRTGFYVSDEGRELERLGVAVEIPAGVRHLDRLSPSIAKQARTDLIYLFAEWTVAGASGMTGEMIRLEKEIQAKGVKIETLI